MYVILIILKALNIPLMIYMIINIVLFKLKGGM